MSEQNSKNGYIVSILVLILDVAMIIPIVHCFSKNWSDTGMIISVLTISSAVVAIVGINKEIENKNQ